MLYISASSYDQTAHLLLYCSTLLSELPLLHISTYNKRIHPFISFASLFENILYLILTEKAVFSTSAKNVSIKDPISAVVKKSLFSKSVLTRLTVLCLFLVQTFVCDLSLLQKYNTNPLEKRVADPCGILSHSSMQWQFSFQRSYLFLGIVYLRKLLVWLFLNLPSL